ncbi:ABC transporter substrate-binding protein [Nocardioides sp. Bht2]|uniref:ABC transporter substrate-binding protein n=1 Tax=Nocardioides sp. Bht2 TaxID=3392297 RepID=UPI0039B6C0EC
MINRKGKGIRRPAAILAAVGLTFAGLTACGSDSSTASSADTVRVVLAAEPTTLDPIAGARSGQVVWDTVIEPLVPTNLDLEPTKDGLVTDWERTDDTTWTFTLREGVTFSNGEPADAEAAVFALTKVRDEPSSILKSFWTNAESFTAPDPTTLVIKTKAPQYDLVNNLGTIYMIPPKYYAEKGPEGFSTAPIGTGPYVFESQRAGRDMTVVRNADYWGDKAETEKIVFSWSSEASQRLALLRSGSADIAYDLPPAQQEEAKNANLKVVATESAMKIVSFLQTDKAPFNDPDVAKAAALAVDRDQIVDGIFSGGAAADGGLLNVKPGEQPDEVVNQDVAQAKSLMKGRSVKVTITYPAGQYVNIEEVAQAVGGQLEGVGFKVKYNAIDYGSLVTQVAGGELDGLYLFAAVPNVAVPSFFVNGFVRSASITKNCGSPELDAMADEAVTAADTEAAEAVYDEINRIAVVERNCYIPLYRMVYAIATAKNVSGLVYNPINATDFTGVKVG